MSGKRGLRSIPSFAWFSVRAESQMKGQERRNKGAGGREPQLRYLTAFRPGSPRASKDEGGCPEGLGLFPGRHPGRGSGGAPPAPGPAYNTGPRDLLFREASG